jgi:4-hydroxy-tetrahydrodipicolinate synthase
MNDQFTGTGVALVTPFDEQKQIDFEALRKVVNHTIDGGIDYLVVMGTTGESVTITTAEKTQVLQVVTEHKKDKAVLLGMGGNNTRNILEQFDEFDSESYDSILSVCPYYNKPSQKGLINHFTMIADKSPKPVILYNVPGRTSVNLSAGSTIELAGHPNIIGIKEASGNFNQCISIAKNTDESFKLISGDDLLALPLISIGATGLISVTANALPREIGEIVLSGMKGNFEKGRKMLHRIYPMIELMFREGNPTGVKALLAHLGLCGNEVRPPLVPSSTELFDQIRSEYSRINSY